jgi:hypothetical protein
LQEPHSMIEYYGMGAMCLADLAILTGSIATIFGVGWYQDKRKRKIIKSTDDESQKEILAEQISFFWFMVVVSLV